MTDEEIKDFGPELLKQELHDFGYLVADTVFASKTGREYRLIIEKNNRGVYCWTAPYKHDYLGNGYYFYPSGKWLHDLPYYFHDLDSLKRKLLELYGTEEW